MLCSLNPKNAHSPRNILHLFCFQSFLLRPPHLTLVCMTFGCFAHTKTTVVAAQSTIGTDQLDPEILESVSKLESDISKTIANNDRLKEAQLEIDRLSKQLPLLPTDEDDEDDLEEIKEPVQIDGGNNDDAIDAFDSVKETEGTKVKLSSEKVSIIFLPFLAIVNAILALRPDCASLVWLIKNASDGCLFCCCRVVFLSISFPYNRVLISIRFCPGLASGVSYASWSLVYGLLGLG